MKNVFTIRSAALLGVLVLVVLLLIGRQQPTMLAPPIKPKTDPPPSQQEHKQGRKTLLVPEPLVLPAPPQMKDMDQKRISVNITAEPTQPEPLTNQSARGGVLLRLAEVGEGPEVEVVWPQHPEQQQQLYRQLQCLGMYSAVITDDHALIRLQQGVVEQSPFDADRFSAYFRQVEGAVMASERQLLNQVAQQQVSGALIRVMPRGVDARLLSGVAARVSGYMHRGTIRAHYRLDDGRLLVEQLQVDGQPQGGRFLLADRACTTGV